MRYVKTNAGIYPVKKMEMLAFQNKVCYVTQDGEVIHEEEVLSASADLEDLIDYFGVIEFGKLVFVGKDKNWIDYDLTKRHEPTLLGMIVQKRADKLDLISVVKYNNDLKKWELID